MTKTTRQVEHKILALVNCLLDEGAGEGAGDYYGAKKHEIRVALAPVIDALMRAQCELRMAINGRKV